MFNSTTNLEPLGEAAMLFVVLGLGAVIIGSVVYEVMSHP